MKQPSWYYLALLILSGEAVFILPFVLPRIFRPTVLEVFQMSNVEWGFNGSIYGLVAVPSYLLGGPLADKFPPRKLIAVALWMTALGGILFATYPSFKTLQLLYGYWGFTTIFLFWAPMIKATRVWGGNTSQGKAFGFLDGGRGLTGFLFGLLGVFIFSLIMGEQVAEASLQESQEAFSFVIYAAIAIIMFVGVLVWFFMKSGVNEKEILVDQITFSQIKEVLKLPAIWLLMVIILCAYVGYKITDVVSQFANEVMLYDQVKSAQVGTFLQFLRPATGILVGLIVDRFKITLWLFLSLVLTIIAGLLFASGVITPSTTMVFFMSVIIIAVGVYAARALYFGVMKEGKIPLIYTGTAVGLISLVGYTPDIFAGPAYGYFLDTYPGQQGYQYVFWMLAGFSTVGAIAAFIYYRLYQK
jgi:MFS family permease